VKAYFEQEMEGVDLWDSSRDLISPLQTTSWTPEILRRVH